MSLPVTSGDVVETQDCDPLLGADEVSGDVMENDFFHEDCWGWPLVKPLTSISLLLHKFLQSFVFLFIPSFLEGLNFPFCVPSDLMYHCPPLHGIYNSSTHTSYSATQCVFLFCYGDFLKVNASKTILGRSITCFYSL